jgi:hypothetical protein
MMMLRILVQAGAMICNVFLQETCSAIPAYFLLDQVPNPSAARHRKQPQLPVAGLASQQLLQHRLRVAARQPLLLGHRHRLIVAGSGAAWIRQR